MQSDGKIVIGGNFTTISGTACGHMARLAADSSLGAGYNPGTGADNNIFALTMQSDGKAVIVLGF